MRTQNVKNSPDTLQIWVDADERFTLFEKEFRQLARLIASGQMSSSAIEHFQKEGTRILSEIVAIAKNDADGKKD